MTIPPQQKRRTSNKEYRISFVPEDCASLTQYWITTKIVRKQGDEPSPAWDLILEYLRNHQTIPKIMKQEFPSGTWCMTLMVFMDERFEHTLRQYVSWLNQRYGESGVPLTVEKMPPDDPPAWGFSLAPPTYSQE